MMAILNKRYEIYIGRCARGIELMNSIIQYITMSVEQIETQMSAATTSDTFVTQEMMK
jgi:hypothetical protein